MVQKAEEGLATSLGGSESLWLKPPLGRLA